MACIMSGTLSTREAEQVHYQDLLSKTYLKAIILAKLVTAKCTHTHILGMMSRLTLYRHDMT